MKALVFRSSGSWYTVKGENGHFLECRLRGKLRLNNNQLTNPVVVGDWVKIEKEDNLNETVISEILPRENYIIRQSPRQKYHDHIIASNINLAILMVTISKPRTSFGFIDRFLTAAACYHIPTIIVINKIDQHNEKDIEKQKELEIIYGSLNYKIFPISVSFNKGIEFLMQEIEGKTVLVSGHSGVGKSSFLNLISPGLKIDTKNISKKHEKGKHTTTFATMYEINKHTNIIDTPGIKEFALTHLQAEELGGYFPEIYNLMPNCQYNNCTHLNEPNCAVIDAYKKGEIFQERYFNYLNILNEIKSINEYKRKIN
jgi:ribosome biogenesis GTPase